MIRSTKKTRDGKEVVVYSYETAAAQDNPGKFFAPLKKKAKEDLMGQNLKWVESLFWQLADITPEAQQEHGVNGGILSDFQPKDQRTQQDKIAGKPAQYQFPYKSACSTRRIYKTQYSGEVVVCDLWRAEFGEAIKNADQHFRLVHLTHLPEVDDVKITDALQDVRIAVCRPDSLSADSRESLAELIAAEQMKRNSSSPNQTGLREYAENKRREAVKAILKCQLDEFRRGKVLTQKGYGIPAKEIFKPSKEREADLGGRLIEKAYDTPLFSPKDLKKDFTDNDAKKLFAGLFHKDAVKAEKDAVLNFGVGLELTVKSHPDDFRPDSSQALTKIRAHINQRSDIPLAEIKTAFCAPPYGLTEAMVVLYLSALLKTGGYELALNPASPITLVGDKPLPGNRLTTHALALCDWNAKLEKALLGARLVVSVQKGWNDVLPYARVLDDTLKTVATPDDEPQRNEQLLAVLNNLKVEVPEVQRSLDVLASKLGGTVPKSLVETYSRFTALTATTSFQEFDAAVRESYPTPADFAAAFEHYAKGRKLCDRAIELSSAKDYLNGACEIDKPLEFDRKALVVYLDFDTLLKDPSIIAARMEEFEKWKTKYTHAYRKAHRAYYEELTKLEDNVEALRPQVRALALMNSIVELGPPLASTSSVTTGFEIVNMLLLDKEHKTFKQIKGAEGVEDVVDKDVLFNLHKPAIVRAESQPLDHDLEHQVSDAVRQHLSTLPGRIQAEPGKYSDEHRTTATINSMLMNSLIPRGVSVEQLNLPFIERVCSRYFRKIGQRWYLRGEAVGGNGNDELFEEEVVVTDNVSAIDWLRQQLQARPMLIGELKPHWMRAIGLLPADVSQSLSLDELLTENFWRDEDTNRWREPTDEERERMNDDRSIRVLHDAERYLADTLRRSTTDAERCDWIDVLFQACRQVEEGDTQSTPTLRDFDLGQGYRLITRLFQSVLSDHAPDDLFAKAQKQNAAASRQVSQAMRTEEAELKTERKRVNRMLFD